MTPKEVLEHRQAVLLASAGALLHNLGKVNSRFVGSKVPPKWAPKYEYQHICGFFVIDVDNIGCYNDLTEDKKKKKDQKNLYDVLKTCPENKDILSSQTIGVLSKAIGQLPEPFSERKDKNSRDLPYRIGDLLEYLGQGEHLYPSNIKKIFESSLLTHLMNRCHHGASGGEKQDIYELQQVLPLYLATPFGYEQPAPDMAEYDKIKGEVEKVILKFLSDESEFSLLGFMAELEPLLRRIPADTRRGVNDVTVWDIGHSGMAFLKSGIWSLAGKDITHNDLANGQSANHPRWRLWRVGLNGLNFLTGAVSVADLRVRQRLLKEYFDDVRRFAEEEYPVATEVYRDENGAIYVFPDWDEGSDWFKAFQEMMQGSVFRGERLEALYGLRPATELSEDNYYNHPECKDWSPAVSYIGDKIQEWIENPLAAESVFDAYAGFYNADICPYCGVQPIGGGSEEMLKKLLPEEERRRCTAEKARQRKICRHCMGARGLAAKEWWEKTPFSTIWVDEASDTNGCVALVVGKFGIEKMLGELVYPPNEVYLIKMKCVKGSLSSPGTRFICDNVRFEVIQTNPHDEQEVVSASKVGTLRRVVKLVAIDFSSSRFANTGRRVLTDPLEVKFGNVSLDQSSGDYELECKGDEIRKGCEILTGCNNLKWKDLKDVFLEFEIENQVVKGEVVGKGTKIKMNQDPVENLLLWTDGKGSFFYVEECKEVNLLTFLKERNHWVGRGASLFSVPSASFARFRRVWETTACFWQEVVPPREKAKDWGEGLASCLAVRVLGLEARRRRLEISLEMEETEQTSEVAPFHAYELEVAGVSMGIVPIEERRGKSIRCVTIENLGYIARRFGAPGKVCADPCAAAALVLTRLGDEKNKAGVRIKETPGYGSAKRDLGTVRINEVKLAQGSYFPVIPILAEPRLFAALVPAESAFDLVRSIKEKYDREMGKVRWRLPLTMGVVFFPKHTPLRAVLDAGWRLLSVEPGEREAKVTKDVDPLPASYLINPQNNFHLIESPQNKPWPRKVSVFVEVENEKSAEAGAGQNARRCRFCWDISTVAGDERTFDVWYPWVKVKGKLNDRVLMMEDNGVTYLHVMELKAGDVIKFYPSTFDFIFLDHPGSRFEIAYREVSRLGLSCRPYYLEEIDKLAELWEIVGGENGLTSTQIHALWQVLLARWQEWYPDKDAEAQKVWEKFCEDALRNAGWPQVRLLEKDRWDKLVRAANSGVLFDVFELFLTILKKSPQRENKK
ncbi:MAG: CRISPR-associated protein Csx11 [Thermacetogeniaceae bacterium]